MVCERQWESFGGERSWPGFMMCLKNLFFSVVSTLLHVDPRKVVFVVPAEASPLPRECMQGFWVQTGSHHVNAHSAGGGGWMGAARSSRQRRKQA